MARPSVEKGFAWRWALAASGWLESPALSAAKTGEDPQSSYGNRKQRGGYRDPNSNQWSSKPGELIRIEGPDP
jgi:hypothetical protein